MNLSFKDGEETFFADLLACLRPLQNGLSLLA